MLSRLCIRTIYRSKSGALAVEVVVASFIKRGGCHSLRWLGLQGDLSRRQYVFEFVRILLVKHSLSLLYLLFKSLWLLSDCAFRLFNFAIKFAHLNLGWGDATPLLLLVTKHRFGLVWRVEGECNQAANAFFSFTSLAVGLLISWLAVRDWVRLFIWTLRCVLLLLGLGEQIRLGMLRDSVIGVILLKIEWVNLSLMLLIHLFIRWHCWLCLPLLLPIHLLIWRHYTPCLVRVHHVVSIVWKWSRVLTLAWGVVAVIRMDFRLLLKPDTPA